MPCAAGGRAAMRRGRAMHPNTVLKAAGAAALVAVLAACGHTVQTTSGSKYLSTYDLSDHDLDVLVGTDEGIAAAADVEPQLRFPARLGLARIDAQGLTAIPPAEAKAWMALAERLGDGYGEFVPVSPLVAALAAPEAPRRVVMGNLAWDYRTSLARVVREVRLGAARQHLDAVLIYEASGTAAETSNPLAVTKLALIGFFLPTEDVEAQGAAQAVLVDVRNGYTYGMASAVAEQPVQRITTSGNTTAVRRAAAQEAGARAVSALTGEVETMMRDLRLALAERRAEFGTPEAEPGTR